MFHCCRCIACAAGVERCIRVAAQAPVAGADPVEDLQAFIQLLNAGLVNSTAAPGAEEHTGKQANPARLHLRHSLVHSGWRVAGHNTGTLSCSNWVVADPVVEMSASMASARLWGLLR